VKRGQPELKIERGVVSAARVMGAVVFKVKAEGVRGWPDRLFFWPGGLVDFVEFKAPGGVLSTNQLKIIHDLGMRDVDVQVVASGEDAARFLQKRREYLARLKTR
jgi:hypothetical protein